MTIGAGWTAAILAAKLCTNGTTMVSLEQGGTRWTFPHFAHDHDSLRYSVRYAMMVDLQRETWTWRPNPNAPALPMRQYGSFNPGQGLGGAAVHWSGQLWRYLETDFRYRSHVVERYGENKIPDGCTAQDWGITYDDLEPLLRRVRVGHRRLRAGGKHPGQEDPGREPVRVAAEPRLPESSARGHAARRELRVGVHRAWAASVHAAIGDHFACVDRSRTGTTAADACTAASARGSAVRWMRRRARSTPTSRLR